MRYWTKTNLYYFLNVDQSDMTSTFETFQVHENDNEAKFLLSVDATCFVQYTCPDCSCGCARKKRSLVSVSDRTKRSACLCSFNEPCTQCTVSNTQHFEILNGMNLSFPFSGCKSLTLLLFLWMSQQLNTQLSKSMFLIPLLVPLLFWHSQLIYTYKLYKVCV